MYKYVYPAVFTPEEDGSYSINFPDVESCYTQGEDIKDGLAMAQDVLALVLYGLEEKNAAIPEPTPVGEIKVDGNSFVSLVGADTLEYRKMYNNKSVAKNVTIPEWLNELASKEKVNFSKLLQDALLTELKINK